MNEIRFFVPGKPAPGGSKKVFPIRKGGIPTGKFVVTDAAGQKNKDWRASVAHEGALALCAVSKNDDPPAWTGPIELELEFCLPRPMSHSTVRQSCVYLKPNAPEFPTTRPDVGKLARSTVDALTHILWADDAQIVKETHSKAYSSRTGCWVIVREAGK